MNDAEIKLLIKTYFDQQGSNQAILAQKTLNDLAQKGNREALAGMRQIAQEEQRTSGKGFMQAQIAASMKAQGTRSTSMQLAQGQAIRDGRSISAGDAAKLSLAAVYEEQARVAQAQAALLREKRMFRTLQDEGGVGGGENAGGGGGYGMRRHFGAVAGQLLGMPGLGMMAAVGGAAAVVGVLTLGLRKLVGVFTDFNEKVNEGTASMRRFELAGLSVDSLALRTQKLTQTNQDFALSYAQIDRQVHTVAAEITILRDLQEHQITLEQKLDDATTQRLTSEAALRNRLNPIQAIKDQEQIEEDAMHRRKQRERDLEQIQLNSLELHKTLTIERAGRFAKEKSELQATLPAIGAAADTAAFNEKSTESNVALKLAAVERMRAALIRRQQADAVGSPFRGSGEVDEAGRVMFALGMPNLASGAIFKGDAAMIDQIGTPDQPKSILGRLRDQTMAAKATSRAASFALESQMRKVGFTDEEIMKARAEFDKTEMEQQSFGRTIDVNAPSRNAEENALRDAMKAREQLEILNAIPSANLSPDGGGASVDEHIFKQTGLLERIAMAVEPA